MGEKVLGEKKKVLLISYSISYENILPEKSKMKNFLDKPKLREFINSRTAPKGLLKGVFQTE